MAFKTKIIFGLFLFLTVWGAQAQAQHPDSIMTQVYRALTLEEPSVESIDKSLLQASSWEALAYIDITNPSYSQNSMQEAVGDVYLFSEDRFTIKMIDQKDPSRFGLMVNGDYALEGLTLHLTKPGSPSFNEFWKVMVLDENYLVLDIEGLRIFFTQTQTFIPKTD